MSLSPDCICFSLVLKIRVWHALTQSILVSNFLFITNPKDEEAGRYFTQGECPCVLLFMFRTMCSPVGPMRMRFLRCTNTATKSLSPVAGVGRLSIKQFYSLFCKTEEYSWQGKSQSGPSFVQGFSVIKKVIYFWLNSSYYFNMEQKIAKAYHEVLDYKQ